jgi:hypothetical protein
MRTADVSADLALTSPSSFRGVTWHWAEVLVAVAPLVALHLAAAIVDVAELSEIIAIVRQAGDRVGVQFRRQGEFRQVESVLKPRPK